MELSVYHTGILITTGINILLGLSVFVMLSTGQLSLGNAGFMAIGAYAASILTVVLKWDLNLAFVGAGLLASLVGLGMAFPALRLSGVYLALATLAFGEIIRVLFQNLEYTGGPIGYRGMSGTTVWLTFAWVTLFLVLFWRLYSSRLGRAFHAVAQDEIVAEAMGLNITMIRVAAFALSGFIGGIAGGLYAHKTMYISPDQFTVVVSLFAVLVAILGGIETFWGVLLGAVLFAVLPEALRFMQDWRMAAYGAMVAGLLIFRPSGLLTNDTFRFFSRKRKRREPTGGVVKEPYLGTNGAGGSALKVSAVSKNFGGLAALHKISFEVPEGKIIGLIGPNGAGKTTLFNVITGFMPPNEGSVHYNGQELTRLRPHQITRLGVARTFQNIRLFGRMTVLDNVLIAQDILAGPSFDTFLGFRGPRERRLQIDAEEILRFFELWERRFERASSLPYGDQQRLEIARALATGASLLLLDEPAAGMNPAESELLMNQLRKVNNMGRTLVVIEHDMSVVMALCDTVVVLNFGEKIAEDTPERIQSNLLVLEAYLGQEGQSVGRKRRKN